MNIWIYAWTSLGRYELTQDEAQILVQIRSGARQFWHMCSSTGYCDKQAQEKILRSTEVGIQRV